MPVIQLTVVQFPDELLPRHAVLGDLSEIAG